MNLLFGSGFSKRARTLLTSVDEDPPADVDLDVLPSSPDEFK